MALFLSTVTNRLDRKGRVSIPAPYRTALAKDDSTGVAVLCDFAENCLKGFDIVSLQAMAEGMQENVSPFSADGHTDALAIFSESRLLEWDAEGRVVLPPDMVAYAELGEEASFVGRGSYFEIWNPATYNARRLAMREKLKVNPPQFSLTGKRRDA